MSKKTVFNRIDIIKDAAARAEIARAHTMIALLGSVSIVLLWVLYNSIAIPKALVMLATILLLLVVLFSVSVSFAMLKKPRK